LRALTISKVELVIKYLMWFPKNAIFWEEK
jgi:hypothetical protein